jgi:hypothetical protein
MAGAKMVIDLEEKDHGGKAFSAIPRDTFGTLEPSTLGNHNRRKSLNQLG